MKSKHKLIYVASYDEEKYPGIHNKIKGFIAVARRMNQDITLTNVSKTSFLKRFLVLSRLLIAEKNTTILIRWPVFGGFLLFLPSLVARIRRCELIAEIPTPRYAALAEIKEADIGVIKKIILGAAIIFDGPWVLWPANKIIQYSTEGRWFSLLNRRKTLLIGEWT